MVAQNEGSDHNVCSGLSNLPEEQKKIKRYGHLPPKEAEAEAEIWDKMCVDLIGPYKIRRKGKPPLVCKCVTMIDPASGWFEIHLYDDKRQSQ